jgi:hypothetical protein
MKNPSEKRFEELSITQPQCGLFERFEDFNGGLAQEHHYYPTATMSCISSVTSNGLMLPSANMITRIVMMIVIMSGSLCTPLSIGCLPILWLSRQDDFGSDWKLIIIVN